MSSCERGHPLSPAADRCYACDEADPEHWRERAEDAEAKLEAIYAAARGSRYSPETHHALAQARHDGWMAGKREEQEAALIAEARLAEAREVLRSVEWAGHDVRYRCPSCEATSQRTGHAPACRLRAVLGDGDA